MKTKNTRVRVSDIKQGVRIFVSHPFFGIEEYLINNRPFVNKYTGSLFVMCEAEWGERETSLCDAGILKGEGYNDRRSFFKMKHAQEWADKMRSDPNVIARHHDHMDFCDRHLSYIDAV